MRARIHRGASEIGGSCIELASSGKRLILDLGLPLDASAAGSMSPLPEIAGLSTGDDASLVGVLISHGHPDHYGLVPQIDANVPVYAGEATTRILREAAFFTPGGADIHAREFLRDREPVRIGPFCVTPHLVDHSAFDAYACLIEAGGRRLFYSGDLRGHGRKRTLFDQLITQPPKDVNVLLLEGTHVRQAPATTSSLPSEEAVEQEAARVFGDTKGLALMLYSPQNIDRLVTLYRGARRAGRIFVLDLYAAAIVAATGRHTIPGPSWENVRVFVPLSQRVRVKNAREFDRVGELKSARLYPEDLAARASELALTFRLSMARELDSAHALADATALWSLWPGYLDDSEQLLDFLQAHEIPLTIAHCSGHATVADLQRLAAAIAPERIVPIHTSQPQMFPELFTGVEVRADGEWWDV